MQIDVIDQMQLVAWCANGIAVNLLPTGLYPVDRIQWNLNEFKI